MDIKSLETLIAIADTGSFSEAAELVSLSPSAVSLRIRSLEEQLCVSLFDRSHRSPILNSEGRAFVERARIVHSNWADLIDDFKPVRHFNKLNFGAVPTSLLSTVPQALSSLRQAMPSLHIKLNTGLSDRLGDMVLRGELDCAVVSEPVQLNEDLYFRPIASEPLIVIAPDDMPGDADIDLLESGLYIRFNKHTWAGEQIEQQLTARKIKLDVTMEVDTLDGIYALVSSGIGVSVVPQRSVFDRLFQNIKAVAFGNPQICRIVGLIEPRINPNRAITDAVFEELVKVGRA